jgi:FkbM family methyltransferase
MQPPSLQTFAISVGPKGRVYSFEPMRIVFQILNANVALGGFQNVWTFQKALGDKDDVVVGGWVGGRVDLFIDCSVHALHCR